MGRGRPYPRITHLPRDSIFACLEHCRASIIALEKSRIAALESSDIEALSALWAQTDVDTGETRHRSGKAEVLRVLELGALKHVRSRRKRLESSDDLGFRGPDSGGGVQLGESDFAPAELPDIEAKRAGAGAALPGEDDGLEPGPDHASDYGVSER